VVVPDHNLVAATRAVVPNDLEEVVLHILPVEVCRLHRVVHRSLAVVADILEGGSLLAVDSLLVAESLLVADLDYTDGQLDYTGRVEGRKPAAESLRSC
jgi:hypothetical protein